MNEIIIMNILIICQNHNGHLKMSIIAHWNKMTNDTEADITDLHNSPSLPNIVSIIMPRRIKWSMHINMHGANKIHKTFLKSVLLKQRVEIRTEFKHLRMGFLMVHTFMH